MLHKFKYHWYQHNHRRPRRGYSMGKWRDVSLDYEHVAAPVDIELPEGSGDAFDRAEERVASLLQRRPEANNLDKYIPKLQKHFKVTNSSVDGLVALLAQAPRAVLAQLQMDTYPHGYRNKKERLYELIDFNDTLVHTILVMDNDHRKQFRERVKQAADRVCKRVGVPSFTNQQWDAIIRGLTREVAVYCAAKESGFNAWLTDRAHDALGIDLQVQDPEDGRYINIDVKTPSSFRHRMEQLVHERRLTEKELLMGDQQNYIIEMNGHAKNKVQVIVLCILPDEFGDLVDWKFVNSEPMRHKLNKLIRDHGIHDGRYGTILD